MLTLSTMYKSVQWHFTRVGNRVRSESTGLNSNLLTLKASPVDKSEQLYKKKLQTDTEPVSNHYIKWQT